jgi:hypothetical protein
MPNNHAISAANDSFCDNNENSASTSSKKDAISAGEFLMEDGVYVKGDFRSTAQILTNMSSYITAYLEHSANKTSEYKVDVRER